MDAPERVTIANYRLTDGLSERLAAAVGPSTEYVRADLYEQQKDMIDKLRNMLGPCVISKGLDDDPDTFGTRWCSAHDGHETPEQCPVYVAK